VEAQDPRGPDGAGSKRWLPHLTRATTWLLATVAAAVIGVVIPGLIGGWLPGAGDDPDQDQVTAEQPQRPPVPRSRLVSSERVGLFNVELDGSAQGAVKVLGAPKRTEPDGNACVAEWPREGVEMHLYDLGGGDPCFDGSFCYAEITGPEWATRKGLKARDRTRRMLALYPDAEYIPEAGLVRRYVLQPPTAPCGPAKGGLEALTASGRVFALRVSFLAGGD
jgi:hypothetical protein